MSEPRIFVVSGGMGTTGEQLARTALAQFEGSGVSIAVVPGVRTASEVQEAVNRAAGAGAPDHPYVGGFRPPPGFKGRRGEDSGSWRSTPWARCSIRFRRCSSANPSGGPVSTARCGRSISAASKPSSTRFATMTAATTTNWEVPRSFWSASPERARRR